MQDVGINISGMMSHATMVIDNVVRGRVTPRSFVIGFLPGLPRHVRRRRDLGYGRIQTPTGDAGQGARQLRK